MAVDTKEMAADEKKEISLADAEKLTEVKLSTTDQKTLDKLKALGLYSDEELLKLEAGMKLAKQQSAAAKGARGEREMVTTFSPVAANVFRARIITGSSVDEIKNLFGTDVSDTNSKVREVALKLVLVGVKEGTISKDWIEGKLGSLNTGKERERKASKDAVVGGEAAVSGAAAPATPSAEANATASTTDEEPTANSAEDENPFESADLTDIETSE